MVNSLNNIGQELSDLNSSTSYEFKTKGERLEYLLSSICNELGEIYYLTEGKADIPYLISIVGTYLISKKKGLDKEEWLTPAVLFDEEILPMLAKAEMGVEQNGE